MIVNFDIESKLKSRADIVERELMSYFNVEDPDLSSIFGAQKYSILGGGKRIRPYLVLAFCHIMGGDEKAALPLACAIEMIHTYSLIHDDLPCMDNDDYRRGKLTNHKVFGEATAVLAGDALLTKAFEAVCSAPCLSSDVKAEATLLLAVSAGDLGMIGGQVMDMDAEKTKARSLEYLKKMHGLKTGALIRASVRLGCIAAGLSTDDKAVIAADRYAEKIGLAFQVIDDMLDVVGDASLLGKNIGSDQEEEKLTFMNFYSVEEAKSFASALTADAIDTIKEYDTEGELRALATYLLERNK